LWHTLIAASEYGFSQRVSLNLLNDGCIVKRTTTKRKAKLDWSRADAMTEAQRYAAALADPDAQPIREEDLSRMPRVPQICVIRRALKLSQEEFAAAYHIPIGTLRDWEQGRKEPDAAARAYLRVIASEPQRVRKALGRRAREGLPELAARK
jgi:putative transcriptional regulator